MKQQFRDLGLIISSAILGACLYSMYHFFKRTEAISPQLQTNVSEIYGLADLKNKKYAIYLPGTDYSLKRVEPTGSMLPTIPNNSIALIKKIDPHKLKIGDIIAYNANNMTICHRIIEIGYDSKGIYFKTKGDNNFYADEWKVRPENIEGVVCGIIW